MNILIDDEQLKSELIELTDFDNINDLKIAIQTLITEYLTDSLLPLDIIENIIIFNDGNFGEVIPIFEKSLKFNICFSKYPILFMYSPILKKTNYMESLLSFMNYSIAKKYPLLTKKYT